MSTPSPASPTGIALTIKGMETEIKQRRKILKWVLKHRAKFDALDFEASFWGGQIDFNNLNRQQILQVIRQFKAGKWTKEPVDEGKVNYETEIDGIRIRLWHGEPPPSCKIVEEIVHVPAHTEVVRKLVCPSKSLN